MASTGAGAGAFVDWRAKPIDKEKHGGTRATLPIHYLVVVTNMTNTANALNFVGYLTGVMHFSIADTSTIITNFLGALCMWSLVGAFLSDSYIKRFHTVLIFGPVEIAGYALLAIQAHLPSLLPPPCNLAVDPAACQQVSGGNAAMFFFGLYIVSFGEGCLRACLPSLGGDQYDPNDPKEAKQHVSWFNWYTFSIGVGVFIGVILVVWIENNRGWDAGFLFCALIILSGLLIVAASAPLFRNQIPSGSPLTRVCQVFVVAFKKRKLPVPAYNDELQIADKELGIANEVLSRTKEFKFLDKAWIETGDKGSWNYCSLTQVEETKIILRLIPIFISSIFGYLPFSLLLPLTVQQGITMDTRIGNANIPPATLFVIPVTFQILGLAFWDTVLVPFLRKRTGYIGGITQLSRIGIGFVFATLATVAAALVEMKRKEVAAENGLTDIGMGTPMSVFWLSIQFFLLGVLDVTSFVGLLEFFYTEVSRGMKSLGASLFVVLIGLMSWIGSLVITIVNVATRQGGEKNGWLDGLNLNKNHLERFYWTLTVIGVLSTINFFIWASRYQYRVNPKIPMAN